MDNYRCDLVCWGTPLFSLVIAKGSFLGIRGIVGLFSPRKNSYIIQRNNSCICPVSRVPSGVPCPIRCPMSHPVSHVPCTVLCPVPCPVSLVPCTVPICIAGRLRNARELGARPHAMAAMPLWVGFAVFKKHTRIPAQRYTWVGCTRFVFKRYTNPC